jgi:hypothetical protein
LQNLLRKAVAQKRAIFCCWSQHIIPKEAGLENNFGENRGSQQYKGFSMDLTLVTQGTLSLKGARGSSSLPNSDRGPLHNFQPQ